MSAHRGAANGASVVEVVKQRLECNSRVAISGYRSSQSNIEPAVDGLALTIEVDGLIAK
jgi:hypothetical protein